MTEALEKFTKRDVASHQNPNCLWVRLVPYDELRAERDSLRAEVARLRLALGNSKQGWENALEIGLFDVGYDFTAQNLIAEARAALAHGEADQ